MEFQSRLHKGKIRERQEDSLYIWPQSNPSLFSVADGMGGHDDGDKASSTCLEVLKESAEKKGGRFTKASLAKSVAKCNEVIHALNTAKTGTGRMGTTLTILFLKNETAVFAHVGDSRLYRLRNNRLKQLTEDHASGDHLLTQAVGLDQTVEVQSGESGVKKNDIYLLCSDGLHGLVIDRDIQQIFEENQQLNDAADLLLKTALDTGGNDNISLIAVRT